MQTRRIISEQVFYLSRITFIVVLCSSLISKSYVSAQTEKATISDLISFLPGTWQNSAFNHVEVWKYEDKILKGFGLAMKGRDTLFYEQLEINSAVAPFIYTSWVAGQNNGTGIQFTLSNATDTSWIFENPNHDFPQKICYIKLANNKLDAFVLGRENGLPRTEHFTLRRKE